MAETAAARAARDVGAQPDARVVKEYNSQSAQRLARLYVDPAGANAAFDAILAAALV